VREWIMRVVIHIASLWAAGAIGAALCWVVYAAHGEHRAIIDESDNSQALTAAVNAYEEWVARDSPLTRRLPAAGSPQFDRHYYEREQKRFSSLSSAFQRHLLPLAGSGGVNVKYLYDLSRAQEHAIGRWLEANAAGKPRTLPDIVSQINVNYGSLERAIQLFKLLLGRKDHGIKGVDVVFRKK
jgi:hypothetical protein